MSTIIRFLVSAVVLMVVSWLIPGFAVNGFIGALIASLVIAGLGWVAERVLGDRISPRSRGVVGFVTSVVVIYLASLLVPGSIQVSWLGAILAAVVIGVVDAFVPTEIR